MLMSGDNYRRRAQLESMRTMLSLVWEQRRGGSRGEEEDVRGGLEWQKEGD